MTITDNSVLRMPRRVVFSNQRFDILAKRIYMLGLYHLSKLPDSMKQGDQNVELLVPIADLNEAHRDRIMKSCDNLASKSIRFVEYSKNRGKEIEYFHIITPFPEAKLTEDRQHIYLKMLDSAVPYFTDLANKYSQVYIKTAISLNSIHSVRLYEILQTHNWRPRWENVSIEYLKVLLGIEKEYAEYDNFKSKVLLMAQKELKQKNVLPFEFEPVKTGRKVTHVTFIFTRGKGDADGENDYSIAPEEMFQQFQEVWNKYTQEQHTWFYEDRIAYYNFNERQRKLIGTNFDLYAKFSEVDAKIECGLITNVRNPTHYMASVLTDLLGEPL